MTPELRERLGKALYEATWEAADWQFTPEVEAAFTLQQIDAILAEIEAAGYALVPVDLLPSLLPDFLP